VRWKKLWPLRCRSKRSNAPRIRAKAVKPSTTLPRFCSTWYYLEFYSVICVISPGYLYLSIAVTLYPRDVEFCSSIPHAQHKRIYAHTPRSSEYHSACFRAACGGNFDTRHAYGYASRGLRLPSRQKCRACRLYVYTKVQPNYEDVSVSLAHFGQLAHLQHHDVRIAPQ